MSNFQNSKIYQIKSQNIDTVYVGRTTKDSLLDLYSEYLNKYEMWKDHQIGLYCDSFEVLCRGNSDISLIEDYPCNDRHELSQRVKYWTDNMECFNKDYQKSKIYIMSSTDINPISYIGSTTKESIHFALSTHIKDHENYISNKSTFLCPSFEVIDRTHFQINLLEEYPCNSKDELDRKVKEWTQTLLCVNNKEHIQDYTIIKN